MKSTDCHTLPQKATKISLWHSAKNNVVKGFNLITAIGATNYYMSNKILNRQITKVGVPTLHPNAPARKENVFFVAVVAEYKNL